MTDIAWTLALHMAWLLAFAGLLRVTGRTVALGPLLAAVGASAIWWAAEVFGASEQGHVPGLSHLTWTWLGKALGILASIVMIAVLPRRTLAEVGLTWRQRSGWLIPALVMMAATCAISWLAQALSHEAPHLGAERLLFQATMPGLDEELFWRGLLLALLARAFGVGPNIAGAPFGAAEIVISVLFGAAHGLRISQGALAFDLTTFVVTGTIGVGLTWLRSRTGSIVIPILTHNLCNFGDSFF